MSKLKIFNEPAESLFRLIGNDENALTFALGYVFNLRKDVLTSFLKEIQIIPKQKGQSYKKLFSDYLIHLQQYNDDKSGIKDLVIEDCKSKRFKIILEAKVDGSLPSMEQLNKYVHGAINNDLRNFRESWIVILSRKEVPKSELVQITAQLNNANVNINFVTWGTISKIIHNFSFNNSNLFEDRIIKELHKFLNMDYKIKYFEHEVFFVRVKKGNGYYELICNQEGHGYYFNGAKTKYIFPSCLYFLACYGPQSSSYMTGETLRKIISYDTLSGQAILSSGDLELIRAFKLHNNLVAPYDDTNNDRIHVFKLGDKITVSLNKRKFKGPNYGFKSLSDFLE
jgi:hypothetical protein